MVQTALLTRNGYQMRQHILEVDLYFRFMKFQHNVDKMFAN